MNANIKKHNKGMSSTYSCNVGIYYPAFAYICIKHENIKTMQLFINIYSLMYEIILKRFVFILVLPYLTLW